MDITVLIASCAFSVSSISFAVNYLQWHKMANKKDVHCLSMRVKKLEQAVEECEREKARLLERLGAHKA